MEYDNLASSMTAARDAMVEAAETLVAQRSELKRLRLIVAKLENWTHEMGANLCPTGADTYGEGVRACKAQVAAILAKGMRP
jgi:hypothetical protein